MLRWKTLACQPQAEPGGVAVGLEELRARRRAVDLATLVGVTDANGVYYSSGTTP